MADRSSTSGLQLSYLLILVVAWGYSQGTPTDSSIIIDPSAQPSPDTLRKASHISPPGRAADTPPNPCATAPCLQPNKGASVKGPDLKPEPIDLTLAYPGRDPPTLSLGSAGVVSDAVTSTGHMVSKLTPAVGKALTAGGETTSKILVPFEIASEGHQGYVENGVPGAVAAIGKATIKEGVGVMTTAAVTPLCGPAVGVVAGACAKEATAAVMKKGEKLMAPTEGDTSFSCAKVGTCKSAKGTVQPSAAKVLQAAGVGSPRDSPASLARIDGAKLSASVQASNAAETYRQQLEVARKKKEADEALANKRAQAEMDEENARENALLAQEHLEIQDMLARHAEARAERANNTWQARMQQSAVSDASPDTSWAVSGISAASGAGSTASSTSITKPCAQATASDKLTDSYKSSCAPTAKTNTSSSSATPAASTATTYPGFAPLKSSPSTSPKP